MTGLNLDHSTEVFHLRFSAIWAGVFFVCAVLLGWLAAAYLEYHEVMADCECITLTIPTTTADLLSYMFSVLTPFVVAGLGVAACSAMRFPALASFRTQGTFKEALYAGSDLLPLKKTLWITAMVFVMFFLFAAYYNLLHAIIDVALALGGSGLGETLGVLTAETTSSVPALFLPALCMSFLTFVWLLRIDIRRQALVNEVAAWKSLERGGKLMAGLNSDHSTRVFYIRFSAICAGVFFVFTKLMGWFAIMLLYWSNQQTPGSATACQYKFPWIA